MRPHHFTPTSFEQPSCQRAAVEGALAILYSTARNSLEGKRMKLGDFEERVWEVEGIRIVVRGDEDDEVESYQYKKAASREVDHCHIAEDAHKSSRWQY